MVSRHGVGYDAVDVTALNQRGIPLTIVGDVNSLSVAEHTLALLLAVAKQVRVYDAGRDPFVAAETFSALNVRRAEELTDGLKMADALTVHLPLSDSKPLLGRTELALRRYFP
ncbi:hypothetical protein [Erwinia sp. MYb416]|uniref:hypothetical protein n=1 Tax=Erwinia sp. MYb416 TaxID=3108532 RepID=UPI0030A2A9E4